MAGLGVLEIPSMREKCSPAEWQARVDLAACYRLVEIYGMADMMANHITLQVPGEEGNFLINAYGMMYEEITASSLIKINLAGEIVARPDFGPLDYGINKTGYVIHGAIHAARKDAKCVIHIHSAATMAVSALQSGILPLTQTSMRFLKAGYHDYEGLVLTDAERVSLVRDLGASEAVILRNHGAITVGETVGQAFNWLHRLELTCKAQLLAMACNQPLSEVPAEVVEDTWNKYQPNTRRPYGVMEWPALLRKLDRLDPSYRN